MSLTEKDVRYAAKLSALELSEDEIPRYKEDLNAILEYFNLLSEVSVDGVVPMSHVHGMVNCFRDDIIKDSLKSDSITENAPDFSGNVFRVPKIV